MVDFLKSIPWQARYKSEEGAKCRCRVSLSSFSQFDNYRVAHILFLLPNNQKKKWSTDGKNLNSREKKREVNERRQMPPSSPKSQFFFTSDIIKTLFIHFFFFIPIKFRPAFKSGNFWHAGSVTWVSICSINRHDFNASNMGKKKRRRTLFCPPPRPMSWNESETDVNKMGKKKNKKNLIITKSRRKTAKKNMSNHQLLRKRKSGNCYEKKRAFLAWLFLSLSPSPLFLPFLPSSFSRA